MIVYERRACTILYNIITSLNNDGRFLLPVNICPIVVATFKKAKKQIEFIDIDKMNLCIDTKQVIDKIKKNKSAYAGLLFCRTYGVQDSFDDFFKELKNEHENLLIVDDKCLSVPITQEIATVADINLYSTGYSKYVDLGYGGFAQITNSFQYKRADIDYEPSHHNLLVQDFALSIKSKELMNQNLIYTNWLDTSKPEVSFYDYFKILEEKLEDSKSIKHDMTQFYAQNILKSAQLDIRFQNWRFNVIVPFKEKLLKQIFDAGLFASSHYLPVSDIFEKGNYPVAQNLSNGVINLFTDRYFPMDKQAQLVEIVNKHILKYKNHVNQ